MGLTQEHDLGDPEATVVVVVNPSDPGRVVPVLLPALLDSRDHCSVDKAAVKGRKRGPVLVVFAPTGNRGSVGEPRGLDIETFPQSHRHFQKFFLFLV